MKEALSILLIAAVLAVAPLACDRSTSNPVTPMTPTATPNPPTVTPTPAPLTGPVTVSAIAAAGSYRYSLAGSGVALSAPITVVLGATVVWDTTNSGLHPLNIDNGSGTCALTGNTTFPYSQAFNTAGTYTFHCSNHGACTGTAPTCTLPCSLMYGTIQVQ